MRSRSGIICDILQVLGVCTVAASVVFGIPALLTMSLEPNHYALSLNMIVVVVMVFFGVLFLGLSKILRRVLGAGLTEG